MFIPRIIAVHGSAVTLRFLSIAVGIMMAPCYPFLRGRLPVARVQGPAVRRPTDRTWLTNKSFWLVVAVSTVQGFGYFVPMLWLPSKLYLDSAISEDMNSLLFQRLPHISASAIVMHP